MPERNNAVNVASIAAVADPPSYTKPLPAILYCDNCGICINENIKYVEDISGYRYGSVTLLPSRFNHIEYYSEEEEITDSGATTYQCMDCDHEFSGNLYTETEFLCEIGERVALNNWLIPRTQEEIDNQPIHYPNGRERTVFTVAGDNNEPCFHPEILPVIDEIIADPTCDFPEFYREHSFYQGIGAEVPETPPEDEEPEMHEVISETNHSRWDRGVQYPQNTVECPKCHFPFIVDSINDEHICPKCKHIWNLIDESQIIGQF